MTLRGQRRTAAINISEEARLNRIAKDLPITAKAPADGIVSQAHLLGQRLTNLFEHGQQIAATFHVDEQAIWEEMLARSRGQRR